MTSTDERSTGAGSTDSWPTAGERAARAPGPWSLRNWRVRSRLLALIAVPTIVAVVLGVVGVTLTLTSAAAYGRVGTMARLAESVTATVSDLQDEQAASAAFVGAGRPSGQDKQVADAQRRTDGDSGRLRTVAASVDESYPDSTRDRVRRALFRLDTLPALRSAVTVDRLPAGVTVDRYDTVVSDLLSVDDEIAQEAGDPGLSASVRALGSLSRAEAALATQRGLLGAALLAGGFEPGGAEEMARAAASQSGNEQQFRTSATVAQVQAYDDVVAGPDVDQTSAVRDGVLAGATPPTGGPAAAGSWDAAAGGALDKIGRVEAGLVRSIADDADGLRGDQVRLAIIVGVVALAVILIVLLGTTAVARSLTRPLRRLRDGALSVAERRLPSTVARLAREDPDTVDTRVEPIAVHSSDEIGEVARSFDAVHREAVRAAAGEARRRAQAGALFVTLSRRTQSLVDRQIALIDDLEQGEENSERLDSLFRLDHLATRMRRNGENLLVLGGQEPVRRWNRTLPVLDVLRAAMSEVEQYRRIDVVEAPDVAVAEGSVSDVVHLLAELLDNATAFSSRSSRVRVAAALIADDSVLIEITDHGIGLTLEECQELEERLTAPGEVDVDVSRRMGLYVVGRLAARLEARVWLRPAEPRGVTVSVALPAAVLIATGRAREIEGAEPDELATTGAEGSWIGERFSRAVATPGPGPDSWFGGSPLSPTGAPGSDAARPDTFAPATSGSDTGGSDTGDSGTGDSGTSGSSTAVSDAAGDVHRHEQRATPEPSAPSETERVEPAGAAAFVPTANGTTEAGLPLREPGANQVPVDAEEDVPGGPSGGWPVPHATPATTGAPSDPSPIGRHAATLDATDRSPEAVRRRYGAYQQGRRGGGAPEAGTTGATSTTGASDGGASRDSGSANSSGGESDGGATGANSGDGGSGGSAAGASDAAGPSGAAGGLGVAGAAAAAGVVGAVGHQVVTGTGRRPRPYATRPDDPATAAPGTEQPGTGPSAVDPGAAGTAAPVDEAPTGTAAPDTTSTDATSTDTVPADDTPTGSFRTVGGVGDQPTDDTPTAALPVVERPGTGSADTARTDAAPDEPPTVAIPVVEPPTTDVGRDGDGTADASAPPSRDTDRAPDTDRATETSGSPHTGGVTDTDRVAGRVTETPWGAAAVREPTADGSTSSGLPQRRPGANYVAGSLPETTGEQPAAGGPGSSRPGPDETNGTEGSAAAEPGPGRASWDRSAEAIRRRFAAHQQGRRRGMERSDR